MLAIGASSASAAACAVPSAGYPSINSALADTSCDPINVAAGSYDESLVIGRDVAIHGAGAAATTIAPTTMPGTIVLINGGANVELDGFTIRYPTGYYIPGYPAAEVIGLQVAGSATANVHNNTITQIHNSSINGNQSGRCVIVGSGGGVTSGAGRGTGTANIHDNVITYCQKQGVTVYGGSSATVDSNEVAYGNLGENKDPLNPAVFAANGIVFNSGSGGSITNNDVHDWACSGVGSSCGPDVFNDVQSVGILPFGNMNSMLVSGNFVHDNDLGFGDYQNTTSTTSVTGNRFIGNLHINAQIYGSTSVWSSNTVSDAPYGLFFSGDSGNVSTLTMTNNIFERHSQYAIYADTSPGIGSLTATNNQFVNNGNGSNVTNAATANMTCNWWGSASGPTTAGNPGGTGDAVTTGAVYDPWAFSPLTYECGPANPQGTLAFAQTQVSAGSTTMLILTLSNASVHPISNTSGAFTLPSGISASAVAGNTCGGVAAVGSGQDISFSGAQIPASGSCTISLLISAGSPGDYTVVLPAGDVLSPRGVSTETSETVIAVTASGVPPIDPIPACVGKELLISDVALTGNRVRIKGYARIKYVGEKVALRFQITGGHIVGYATVQADGSWTTSITRPARRFINSNNARYQAAIGGGKTSWIKLKRRMGSTNVAYGNGNYYVTGSVLKPLVPGARLNVTISGACQPYKLLGTLPVNRRNGRFSGVFGTPLRNTVVLARLNVRVRHSSGGRSSFSTYSILQPVVIH